MKTFFIHTGIALFVAIMLSVVVFLYVQYEISRPIESTTSQLPQGADLTETTTVGE